MLWRITKPKERDTAVCCEAPLCKKVITPPVLECGVCGKKIHVACDPKTMYRKMKTLKLVSYYCSFHWLLNCESVQCITISQLHLYILRAILHWYSSEVSSMYICIPRLTVESHEAKKKQHTYMSSNLHYYCAVSNYLQAQ